MIVIPCEKPEYLLDQIKKKIDTGTIKSWSYDKDGDFTISSEQWSRKAWLRPHPVMSSIQLNIFPPEGAHISKLIYAIFHARFVEMVLHRFDEELSGSIEVTPLPQGMDLVS